MNESGVAVVSAGRAFTYADLEHAAGQVAAALAGPSDDLREARAAFLIPPGFEYAAVQRGIWRAGGVAVPLAVTHPPPELEYVIRDTTAAFVIGTAAAAATLMPLAREAGAC